MQKILSHIEFGLYNYLLATKFERQPQIVTSYLEGCMITEIIICHQSINNNNIDKARHQNHHYIRIVPPTLTTF